jgi:hypothetical protein
MLRNLGFIWHNALIYPGGFEQLEKDFEVA